MKAHKKSLLLGIGIAGIVLLAGVLFAIYQISATTSVPSQQQTSVQTAVQAVQSGDTQILRTAVTSRGYSPAALTAQAGKPIRFIVDGTQATGCYRSIVSQQMGFRGTLQPGENVFDVPALKPGTYQFSCSMGMIRGTVTVLGTDGTAPPLQAQQAQPAGGSCGSSGGCGCGSAAT